MQKVFYGAKMGVTGEYSNTLRLTPVHTNTVMLCTFALASLLYMMLCGVWFYSILVMTDWQAIGRHRVTHSVSTT